MNRRQIPALTPTPTLADESRLRPDGESPGRSARYDRRRNSTPLVSVVLPTYNEATNLPLVVEGIERALVDFDYEIIVVDDDSPDLTWKKAEQLAQDGHRVRAVRRTTERGLSSAVVTGMNIASGSVFIVMDADLQHDPVILPDLVSAILDDHADICLGSREAVGGSYGDFGRKRRFISWVGAQAARSLLRLSIGDPMSGYFAVSRQRFEQVVREVNPRGFKILLELIARGAQPNVAEVGYTFGRRQHGATKLTGSIIVSYCLALLALTVGRRVPVAVAAYALVGASGLLVRGAGLVAGGALGLANPVLLAVEASVLSNYLLNNRLTFVDRPNHGLRHVRGLALFHCISAYGLLVQAGVAEWLRLPGRLPDWVTADAGWLASPLPALVGLLASAAGGYFLNSLLTWPAHKASHQAT